MTKIITKKRLIFYIPCFLMLFGGLAYYSFASSYFIIKEISIIGNKKLSAKKIRNKLNFQVGDNILIAPNQETTEELKEISCIKEVELRKNYPDKVSIFIQEKEPVVLINLDQIYGLSTNLELIPFDSPVDIPNLPIITGVDIPAVKTKPYHRLEQEALSLAIKLVHKMGESSPNLLGNISEINIVPGPALKTYLIRPNILVDWGNENLDSKITNLRTILDKINSQHLANLNKIELNSTKLAVLNYKSKTMR